jgi:hypothetical protein
MGVVFYTIHLKLSSAYRLSWTIIGDFDRNGKADVICQDSVLGWTVICLVDRGTVSSIASSGLVGNPNSEIIS